MNNGYWKIYLKNSKIIDNEQNQKIEIAASGIYLYEETKFLIKQTFIINKDSFDYAEWIDLSIKNPELIK